MAMTQQKVSNADFYLKQLSVLLGGKITHLARTQEVEVDESGDEFYGLVVTMPNGDTKTLILFSDDEGNAPGSFEIQEDE